MGQRRIFVKSHEFDECFSRIFLFASKVVFPACLALLYAEQDDLVVPMVPTSRKQYSRFAMGGPTSRGENTWLPSTGTPSSFFYLCTESAEDHL